MIESASAQLSGAQKAAILMLSLGTENSAKVMSLLGEGEVTQITAEIVKAGQISRDESTTTLEEFAPLLVAGGRAASGGPDAARGAEIRPSMGRPRDLRRCWDGCFCAIRSGLPNCSMPSRRRSHPASPDGSLPLRP